MGSQIEVHRGDNGALVVNASQIDLGAVATALDAGPGAGGGMDESSRNIMAAMASWVGGTQPTHAQRRVHGIFNRDTYVNPDTPFAKMRVARTAVARDDIVGTAARLTEGLALNASTIRCPGDLDQQDVWQQIAADLNLDGLLRDMWRVLFTDSQFVAAVWWGTKEYTSRRKTKAGQQSRKKYTLTVPLATSLIDTTRVAPVGTLMFGQERLAFIANDIEADFLDRMLAARDGRTVPPPRNPQRGTTTVYDNVGRRMLAATVPETGMALVDPIVARLMTSRYVPDPVEAEQLRADGIDPTHLFLFDDRFVWRHTKTKGFARFAPVDLEMVFELLDLKHQLRALDRAHLIGGANYIVLVTKGSDKIPGTQPEVDNLRAHVRTLGQVPVLVGDARLKVEIITPKIDMILDRKKHDTIDVRIAAAVYKMFMPAGEGQDDPLKSGRVIARGLESERRMLRRTLEAEIFQLIRDANPGVMTERAKLVYLPGTISLAFDSAWATFLLDLREAREISRETMLGQMDLDQSDEAALLELESTEFDPIFKTIVPHGVNPGDTGQQEQVALPPGTEPSQQRAAMRRAGRRQGGNRNGGGRAPGTQQGKETVDPRRSDTGPAKRPRAELVTAMASLGHDIEPDADMAAVAELLEDLDRDGIIAVASALPPELQVKGRHRNRRADTEAALLDLTDDEDD